MVDEDFNTDKWRQLSTYFSGKLSMFVTYPLLTFCIGLVLGYVTST
ncbi:hypothetical protein BPODLACK_03339 [Gordonia sp. YY1]|nr:hypothetical protein BPODLACK_03339 [Gordonia sp. YY1]